MSGRRLFNAPEVIQTSSMDCGPAALKCLLEGFGRPVSYGRLREACQTDVDGSSIDTLEAVARLLGVDAEQELEPLDHALEPDRLPALVVVTHADAATHFVVAWRRIGRWIQVMDPSLGRRWIPAARFMDEIYRHDMAVDAPAWRDWAGSPGFLNPLARRLHRLGASSAQAEDLIAEALAPGDWFALAALDASVRLAATLSASGGARRGPEAFSMARALFQDTTANTTDIFGSVPAAFWSVSPDPTNTDASRERLRLRGAVILRAHGLREPSEVAEAPLSPELEAALEEAPVSPLRTMWGLLREDDLTAPAALLAAVFVAASALMFEALLFRGLFGMSGLLALPYQRLTALAALVAFSGLLFLIEAPIQLESLRQGRKFEARLRMALMAKLPRLQDHYFQSRPISDMAERGHSIHLVRGVPALGLQFTQTLCEMVLTYAAVVFVAPELGWAAAGLLAVAMVSPFLAQPALNERDLKVRNQAGALHGFHLDALLGLSAIRSHRAERSVARLHEGMLVAMAGSLRRAMGLGLASTAVQSTLCSALAAAMLVRRFHQIGDVSGADLLLVFWMLKLPFTGGRLAALAQAYPAQRNALLRLVEPLSAPEELSSANSPAPHDWLAGEGAAVSVRIEGGRLVAGGHEILRDLDLTISPGEHVAVVGASGAGKSSLLGLLLGWRRLAEGRVLVDGVELDAERIRKLRKVTAWVDPAVQIWNRTFMDNLTYGAATGDLGKVGRVIQASRLRGVAESLPQGLQSWLGEGGGRLSGGEGQRLRLGRALMAGDRRLVLLDEPFRGTDREQRRALLDEARDWWRDQTLVCVTHDVGETRGFHRVLVIEGGAVIEDGPPAVLAAGPTRYRELLDAEAEARTSVWGARGWRRLKMAGGRLQEAAS